MKAFVHMLRKDGTQILGTGFKAGSIVESDLVLPVIISYVQKNYPAGNYEIEGFHNWDRRYYKADVTERIAVQA